MARCENERRDEMVSGIVAAVDRETLEVIAAEALDEQAFEIVEVMFNELGLTLPDEDE